MTRLTSSRLLIVLIAFALSACGKAGSGTSSYVFTGTESSFDSSYKSSSITLVGRILDEDNTGVAGCTVTAIAWGDASANADATETTDAGGTFQIEGLERRSVLLRIELAGYYTEIIAVDLQRPLAETTIDAGSVILIEKRSGLMRFVIGGDSMFGRRYVDRDEDGEGNTDDDLIHDATRGDDARALMEFLRPVLTEADYTQVNLETPVAEEATEEHPYKEFKFFTHPDTLVGLTYAGVDGVSLGNNHVFDLLETGMVDTLTHVDDAGLDWFGAGFSETGARENLLARTIEGVDFSMQGFNGILPNNFPPWGPIPWADEFMYNAMDTPIVKGGSLELNNDNVDDFHARAAADSFAMPIIHGGFEYGEYPSANMRAKVARCIEADAGIVIAHHPHTVYGIATLEGHASPTIAILSLGNLVFDQDVFETFQSFVAVIDVEQTSPGNHTVQRVRLVPFHIEGYIPKMVVGDRAGHIARHTGHISTHLPDLSDGLVGAVVFPAHNRVAVCTDDSQYNTTDDIDSFSVPVEDSDSGPIRYERTEAADMLARVRLTEESVVELGRDLMLYGDFEDLDIDDEFHESHLWNQSDARYAQNSDVRSGTGAFALLRRSSESGFASTWLRNRITFSEGKQLTVRAHIKGDNAGRAEFVVRWFIRDERTIISTTVELEREAGSYDWEPVSIDLTPPADAGTIRVFIRHYPPASSEGSLLVDDMSVIQWESIDDAATLELDIPTPNNWSWLRVFPTADTASVGLGLTHRIYSLDPSAF